ncbi:MAG: CapA family protein [Clostridia bacterium]|nr:CapA family protein [Clostridia bacterium]
MRRNINNNDDSQDQIKSKNNKKKRSIIIMLLWLVICMVIYYQVFMIAQYTLGKTDKENVWLYNSVSRLFKKFSTEKIDEAIKEEYSLKLAALGDIYTTQTSLANVKSGSTYNFTSKVENIKKFLTGYDVVLASLNTPIASNTLGYSSKTVYNSPKSLLDMLKTIGVTTVATANNHIYDKSEKGIQGTIDSLKELQINQIGINSSSTREKPLVIEKNNIKIGVLSYATSSKVSIAKAKEYMVNILDEKTLKEDISYLKTQKVDFIISYLNIPNEESSLITSDQKTNVELLFENGVNVVFGTGSLVIQDDYEDLYETSNGAKSHVYSIYSLGDFIGANDTDDKNLSLVGNINFTKKVEKDKNGTVNEAKTQVDMLVEKPLALWTKIEKNKSTTIYEVDSEVKNYDENNSNLTSKEYNNLKTIQTKIDEMYK